MDNWFDSNETRRRWPFATDRKHPVIHLREVRLLSSLDAIEPIRRVEFHPGLNIIWADPKVKEARQGGPRLAGHSAGKTTLCRIIRWLLGEAHFGTEETETAIALAFPTGWALLHVELDGVPWTIGRAFFQSNDHRAVCGAAINQVQGEGWPEPNAKSEFFEELSRLTISPLVRQQFPGANDNIKFTDLLAWLARDQEAALQRVESWRSTTSGNSQTVPDKANRHILMRLVLKLLEDDEWKEMQKCAKLEIQKDAWKKQEPDLEASARAACEPLARVVGPESDALAGPLVISKAEKLVKEKQSRLEELQEDLEKINLSSALADLEHAITDLAKGDKAVESATKRIKQIAKRVSERDAELITAKAAALATKNIPQGICAKKRDDVKGLCPLYEEAEATAISFTAAQMAAEIQKQQDHLQEALAEEQQELRDAESRILFLREKEVQMREVRDETLKNYNLLQGKIATLEASLRADREVLQPATTRQSNLDECQRQLSELSEKIKESTARQKAIRKARWQERNAFADNYRSALKQLTDKGAGARLEFDADGLFDLQTSGAAVTALKVLAFDLAAMLWSANGQCHHPRLLIHDSPRVADMSLVPYSAIFDLVAAAEGDSPRNANFQYIITTTESPPEDLHDKHLILTLDASREDGLLFKRSFE
jgi:hypothetical protein